MVRSGKREIRSFGYLNPDRVIRGEGGFVDMLINFRGGLWWFGCGLGVLGLFRGVSMDRFRYLVVPKCYQNSMTSSKRDYLHGYLDKIKLELVSK